MQNFNLTTLFTINDLSAASGLWYTQKVLFLISDSSSFLYQYDLEKKLLLKFPLIKEAAENCTKEAKLDLESITQHGNQLILLGSGSTPNRNSLFTLDLSTDQLQKQDLSVLYQKLKKVGAFSDDQFNIEGAIYAHQTMLLFQRGNSKNSKNGIFIVPNLVEDVIKFIPIDLPTLDGVATTFTDAILVQETIYFLASAERTTSTFDDGEILGSILGIMHAPTFEIIDVMLLSEHQKFEGITHYKTTENEIEFLVCADNDAFTTETIIYQLTVPFKR